MQAKRKVSLLVLPKMLPLSVRRPAKKPMAAKIKAGTKMVATIRLMGISSFCAGFTTSASASPLLPLMKVMRPMIMPMPAAAKA